MRNTYFSGSLFGVSNQHLQGLYIQQPLFCSSLCGTNGNDDSDNNGDDNNNNNNNNNSDSNNSNNTDNDNNTDAVSENTSLNEVTAATL